MTTLQEIEAALPKLSTEELAQVEALLQSVRREREEETAIAPAPEPASTPEGADRPKRKMVPSPYNNGLWVLEAVPGVVITTEMIKKIQDEMDEEEFQDAMRFYRGGTTKYATNEGEIVNP